MTTIGHLPSPPVTYWGRHVWPGEPELPPTYAEVMAACAGDREGNWADRPRRAHGTHPLTLAIAAALA